MLVTAARGRRFARLSADRSGPVLRPATVARVRIDAATVRLRFSVRSDLSGMTIVSRALTGGTSRRITTPPGASICVSSVTLPWARLQPDAMTTPAMWPKEGGRIVFPCKETLFEIPSIAGGSREAIVLAAPNTPTLMTHMHYSRYSGWGRIISRFYEASNDAGDHLVPCGRAAPSTATIMRCRFVARHNMP